MGKLFKKRCSFNVLFNIPGNGKFCVICKSIIKIVRNFKKNFFLTTGQRSGFKAEEIHNGQCSE